MDLDYAKYLSKKTQENYNQIAKDFSKYREKPWPEAQFLADDYVASGDKVLDLGCGAGQWFEFFKEKKVDYLGVDFSERLIEIAKEKYPAIDFKVADVLNLPFPDNFFDKVCAIALFHALPSKEIRKKALQEAKRILKKKGLLVLTCWNLWQKRRTKKLIYKFILLKILGKSKLDFKDILMDWQGMKDCYFHCFSQKELRKAIERESFKVLKSGKFSVNSESNLYIIAEK